MKLVRFLALVVLVAAVLVLTTGATGDATQIADGIAGVVILLSPLGLKYVHLDGPQMVAVSYLVALLIAAVALWLSGQFQLDLSSVPSLLSFATVLFGLQQVIFQGFKDHPLAAPLLK